MGEPDSAWTLESFTAGDGYQWRYRRYKCQSGAAKARVVCLHGIQSHAGWYEYSCTELSRAGYEVFFLDRRGSGVNQAARGDAPSFRRLVDDVGEFLVSFGSDPGGRKVPVFLIGISWGGKLATALALGDPGKYVPNEPNYTVADRAIGHRGLVDGVVLLCPGFFPRVRPRLSDRLRIAWARAIKPSRLFPIPLNDPELFTATPKWQDFIRNDLLGLKEATARLLVESVRLDRYLRSATWRGRVPMFLEVPVLLMLAERDRIIDNARTRAYVSRIGQRFVKGKAALIGFRGLEIIEYPGASHTLEFEPDPSQFVSDLRAWFDRKLLTTTR